jgi:hypothetical protein
MVPKISRKSFAQTIEQMDIKNPNKELYTDKLSRWIRKIRTKSSTQTLGQMDSKN